MTKIEATIRDWLQAIPSVERSARATWLVSRLWAIKRELEEGHKPDPNRARKLAGFKAAIAREWETPRANRAPQLADEQLAWHAKCKARLSELGAAGLYISQLRRGHIVAMQAIWHLPNGTFTTPATPKIPCCFEQLHASLSLPRVPVAGDLDPAYLITDF